MSNLAVREFRIELFPGFIAWIRPWQTENKVFFDVEVQTPYGKVKSLFSMDPPTFEQIMDSALRSNQIPRLWSLFKEQLGWIPKIYSVDTNREIIPR